MSRLNDPENFRGRVAYAAKVIAYGKPDTRALDNCFENGDGDVVVAAIVRRSKKNARLAANLPGYLDVERAEKCALRFADIPTRKLVDAARLARHRTSAHN